MGSETSLLLPVLMAATLGAAEPGRPTLSGFVRNAEGKPIQGALVFVSTARPRQGTSTTCPSCYLDCRKRATTRADGAFEISSLDPSLLFQVGAAADGYVATFARDVDPSAGRLGLSLVPEPEAPSSPRQLMRGRIIDADGQPVVGALVDPIGYRLDGEGPSPSWSENFGPFGVSPTVSGTRGQFTFVLPQPADSLFVSVDGRGLAPKTFGRVATGADERVLRMGVGRTIRGRLLRGEQPISHATVGVAQLSRNSETFVGERTAETDGQGRFLLLNIPPDEPLVLYGKVGGMGEGSVLGEREIDAAPEGDVADLGAVGAVAGVILSGKVILEDGKPLPQKTRIAVSRLRAWDTVEAELSATGEFRLGPFPMESVELSIRVPGYELSTENASLLPAYDDSRTSLGGHLGRDTQLRIVLSPVRDRPRAKTPRTANEWTAFNAKAEAIRAKELQGAPIDK